ncbi:MAG: beta-lactamase family protein [Bacteroidales bacterium]|jgi:CubicO group peptidase (beta-lactamase class C family)|nr:beta-lactamase family protein [Bacteroidales bacterium]
MILSIIFAHMIKPTNRLFFFLSIYGLLSINITLAQHNRTDFDIINDFFDSISVIIKTKQIDSVFHNMSKEKQFNGSLLIGKQHKIVYTNFSGYADYPAKIRLNKSSQFEIASGSKQFTAIAILMLYEQKKLQLSDTIQKFIPDFPYKGITIHQLLCHRSGLPDYFKFAEKYHQNKDYLMTNDSLLNMMKVYRPKSLEIPDKGFEYSNTGYAVLASIVERISGMPFSEFITRFIFEPTGMKESYFYHYGKNQQGGYTVGHKNNLKHYERDFLSGVLGDKGIFTTAHDLYLWDNALYEAKIIRSETLQMAFSPQNPEKSPCDNYGYGWRLSCDKYENTLVYHGGLWNGNNSLFLKRISDKTLIIILSNVYNRGFSGRSAEILSILDSL